MNDPMPTEDVLRERIERTGNAIEDIGDREESITGFLERDENGRHRQGWRQLVRQAPYLRSAPSRRMRLYNYLVALYAQLRLTKSGLNTELDIPIDWDSQASLDSTDTERNVNDHE